MSTAGWMNEQAKNDFLIGIREISRRKSEILDFIESLCDLTNHEGAFKTTCPVCDIDSCMEVGIYSTTGRPICVLRDKVTGIQTILMFSNRGVDRLSHIAINAIWSALPTIGNMFVELFPDVKWHADKMIQLGMEIRAKGR